MRSVPDLIRSVPASVDLLSLVNHRKSRVVVVVAAAGAVITDAGDVGDVSIIDNFETRLAGKVIEISDQLVT